MTDVSSSRSLLRRDGVCGRKLFPFGPFFIERSLQSVGLFSCPPTQRKKSTHDQRPKSLFLDNYVADVPPPSSSGRARTFPPSSSSGRARTITIARTISLHCCARTIAIAIRSRSRCGRRLRRRRHLHRHRLMPSCASSWRVRPSSSR